MNIVFQKRVIEVFFGVAHNLLKFLKTQGAHVNITSVKAINKYVRYVANKVGTQI